MNIVYKVLINILNRSTCTCYIYLTLLQYFLAASIDIKEVFQDGNVDSKTLQTVLPGIAFCSLEDEFNNQKSNVTTEVSLPPGFAKIFHLAQLIIQYLLHSQKKLTEAIKLLQTNNSGLQKVLY